MAHFECPAHDWSFDDEDEIHGYVALYEHELALHSGRK